MKKMLRLLFVILMIWMTACNTVLSRATLASTPLASNNTSAFPSEKLAPATHLPPTLTLALEPSSTPEPSPTRPVPSLSATVVPMFITSPVPKILKPSPTRAPATASPGFPFGKLFTSTLTQEQLYLLLGEVVTVTQNVPEGVPGKLYLWGSEDYTYGSFDPGTWEFERLHSTQKGVPGPAGLVSLALDLAFSQYSRQVAYIKGRQWPTLPPDIPTELWIADLNLQHIQRAWVDEDHWLGEISFDASTSRTTWGVDDRYILIYNRPLDASDDRLVVYDTRARKAYQWLGSCDWIARSTVSDALAIWCSLQTETGTTYAVLEKEGIVQTKTPPQTIVADTAAWRFSPDGSRVLYIAKQDGRIAIASQDGTILEFPFAYNPEDPRSGDMQYSGPEALNFQWSRDGRRVLVRGLEDQPKLCPKVESIVTDEYCNVMCWFVLDARTGRPIWWPSEQVAIATGTPLSSLDYWNSALSPDGKWLAVTISIRGQGSFYTTVVVSLASGEAWEIHFGDLAYYVTWDE